MAFGVGVESEHGDGLEGGGCWFAVFSGLPEPGAAGGGGLHEGEGGVEAVLRACS